MNGPTRGKDVFVPVDAIIGGPEMAGRGWLMLMQSLSAGRGISLPSLSASVLQLATRSAGAYASVREQFDLPIGRFEGVQEKLARLSGLTYAIDSVRQVTAAAVDAGEKPSVVSAIAKAYATEAMRTGINDALDVFGGAGIARGPRNILGGFYQAAPIGITVEGANILTRTMIVFGQGAMRGHPFVRHEVEAIAAKNVETFDRFFFGHVGFAIQSVVRAKLLGFTDGRLASSPVDGPLARSFQRLTRMSAAFASTSDVALATLGGELKRREQLAGRLADALAWLYIASATLKRFVDDGQSDTDRPYLQWVVEQALYEIQTALCRFYDNLPNRTAGWIARLYTFPLGARYRPPSDRLARKLARGVLSGGDARLRLSRGIHVPAAVEPGLGMLEDALAKVIAARPVLDSVKAAVRARKLARRPTITLLDRAEAAGVITAEEREIAAKAQKARAVAVAVDDFEGLGSAG
jgi:acyl-CoA dehydrogenase